MNHEIVPEHKPPIEGHMIVDICLIALIPVTFLLAAAFHAWGFMPTFIGVLSLLGLGIIAVLLSMISHHWQDIADRKTMRKLAEDALRAEHSVEFDRANQIVRTISPHTIPNGPLTIKDVTLGDQAQLPAPAIAQPRSEEHTSELQSPDHLVCRLLLQKTKTPALNIDTHLTTITL